MSYCRFSTDDYQCDVYVYADVFGSWTIHVAGSKVRPPAETRPAPIGAWWERGEAGIEEFMAHDNAVDAWLATAPRLPIGLAHDGETFREAGPDSCADRLEMLAGLGYQVPRGVIDALREEAAEAIDPPAA